MRFFLEEGELCNSEAKNYSKWNEKCNSSSIVRLIKQKEDSKLKNGLFENILAIEKKNRESLHALEDIIKKPKILYYRISRREGAESLFKENKAESLGKVMSA